MTTTAVRARDTPGRTATPQRVVGALFVDMDGFRARYECLRPECPHRVEGPVHSTDRGPTGFRLGIEGLKAFIDSVKADHLDRYHGEQR